MHHTEGLSGVLKRKKAVSCLSEKIQLLDTPYPGTGDGTGGREFNMIESPGYIEKGVFKQKSHVTKVVY